MTGILSAFRTELDAARSQHAGKIDLAKTTTTETADRTSGVEGRLTEIERQVSELTTTSIETNMKLKNATNTIANKLDSKTSTSALQDDLDDVTTEMKELYAMLCQLKEQSTNADGVSAVCYRHPVSRLIITKLTLTRGHSPSSKTT